MFDIRAADDPECARYQGFRHVNSKGFGMFFSRFPLA
jgi:hypothetical protein